VLDKKIFLWLYSERVAYKRTGKVYMENKGKEALLQELDDLITLLIALEEPGREDALEQSPGSRLSDAESHPP
jgi:hypothetical protein